jgi:hypothetical protein
MLYALGRRLSIAIGNQPCEYLIQEASMAFAKTMMSLLGFLRFIPSSRFHAKEGESVIDLSSASVMARQVMEDAVSFYYLSEGNLTQEEKQFREDVWRFHGATESIESARFANVSNPARVPAAEAALERRREALQNHPMLAAMESDRRGRIRQGRESHVLHDREILGRRGIQADVYNLGRKVLSNFAHFSTLSHQMIMATSADWEKSWRSFLAPALYAANFAAEAIEASLETFPNNRRLLSEQERTLVANYRNWLRETFEPRVLQD